MLILFSCNDISENTFFSLRLNSLWYRTYRKTLFGFSACWIAEFKLSSNNIHPVKTPIPCRLKRRGKSVPFISQFKLHRRMCNDVQGLAKHGNIKHWPNWVNTYANKKCLGIFFFLRHWPLLSKRHFHKVGWDVMLHSAGSRQQLRAAAVIAGCSVGLAETSWWRVMLHRLKQPTPQLTATAARCRRLCRHRGWRPALMASSDIFPRFCNICQEISPVGI